MVLNNQTHFPGHRPPDGGTGHQGPPHQGSRDSQATPLVVPPRIARLPSHTPSGPPRTRDRAASPLVVRPRPRKRGAPQAAKAPYAAKVRLIITTQMLRTRAGAELATLEVAAGLARRGHEVAVFTIFEGPLGFEFARSTGIPVFGPGALKYGLPFPPECLHIHHWTTLATLQSLAPEFGPAPATTATPVPTPASPTTGLAHAAATTTPAAPTTATLTHTPPAILGVLGTKPAMENPPLLVGPGHLPWWGISEKAVENVASIPGWVAQPHQVVRNWFIDDASGPPPAPSISAIRSALVVSNHRDSSLDTQIEALRRAGIEVDCVGTPWRSVPVTNALLAQYDLVVTLGRTAVKALALGIPCLLLTTGRTDGMVRLADIEAVAAHNFSGLYRNLPPDPATTLAWVRDVPDQAERAALQGWIWEHCRFSAALERFEAMYAEAVDLGQPYVFGKWAYTVANMSRLMASTHTARLRLGAQQARARLGKPVPAGSWLAA